MTTEITRTVTRWAVQRGWTPRVEARIDVPNTAESARLGFVDVLVRRAGPLSDLAIEIDSGDKPWSVEKLRHAAAAGMHAVWIRWGDKEWAGVYDDVDVIQLQTQRRVAHRSEGRDQLSLWPSS